MRSATRAGAQADPPGALADGGEKDLGRGGMAVLLEEVVLDLPHGVDAQTVGELDLLERILQQPVLVAVLPRSGQLVLVEDPELHGAPVGDVGPATPQRSRGAPPGARGRTPGDATHSAAPRRPSRSRKREIPLDPRGVYL
jgi:hypothetical protein